MDSIKEILTTLKDILSLKSASWVIPNSLSSNIFSLEDAEELANQIRKIWSLGKDPIPNMTELLEEKGIKVERPAKWAIKLSQITK